MGAQLDMFASRLAAPRPSMCACAPPAAADAPAAIALEIAVDLTAVATKMASFARDVGPEHGQADDDPARMSLDISKDCAGAAAEVAVLARDLGAPAQDPGGGAPWLDELTAMLQASAARAEQELRELRRVHAQILGCSEEDLDQRLADDKRREKNARSAVRASSTARPSRTASPRRTKQATLAHAEEPDAPPTRHLGERERDLLSLVRVEGNRVVYTRNEHVPDWVLLKAVVESLGGRWTKGSKKRRAGWDFPEDVDATETIRLAHETGEIIDPKAAGFVPTPDGLAEELVRMAAIPARAHVLEPSAGTGRIAGAVQRLHPDARVLCVELLPDNRKALVGAGFELLGSDFLKVSPSAIPTIDAVVMNPPFRAEVEHIEHALRFVRPGGRLAGISSAGLRHRETSPYQRLRATLAQHGAVIEENPEGSFLESGTGVRSVRFALTVGGAS